MQVKKEKTTRKKRTNFGSVLSVRLSVNHYDTLNDYIARTKLSRSKLLRDALETFIANNLTHSPKLE